MTRDELLAAELVLGTLDAPERAQARQRLQRDADFSALVRRWERDLAPLHELVAPIAPPPAIWRTIAEDLARAQGAGAAATAPQAARPPSDEKGGAGAVNAGHPQASPPVRRLARRPPQREQDGAPQGRRSAGSSWSGPVEAARTLAQKLGARIARRAGTSKVSPSLLPREAAQLAAPRHKRRAVAEEGAAVLAPSLLPPAPMGRFEPVLEPGAWPGSEAPAVPTRGEADALSHGAPEPGEVLAGEALAGEPLASVSPSSAGGVAPAGDRSPESSLLQGEPADAPSRRLPAEADGPRDVSPLAAAAARTGDVETGSADAAAEAQAPGLDPWPAGAERDNPAPPPGERPSAVTPAASSPGPGDAYVEAVATAIRDDARTVAIDKATSEETRGEGGARAGPGVAELASPAAGAPSVMRGDDSLPASAAASGGLAPRPEADEGEQDGTGPGRRSVSPEGRGEGAPGHPLPLRGDLPAQGPPPAARTAPDNVPSATDAASKAASDVAALAGAIPDIAVLERASLDTVALHRTSPDLVAAAEATPDMAAPAGTSPELAPPESASPELSAPDVAAPDLATPDVAAPDLAAPDLATPDLATPDLAALDTRAADSAIASGAALGADRPAAGSGVWRKGHLHAIGGAGAGRALLFGALLAAVAAAADVLLQWGGYGGGVEPRAVTLVPERAAVGATVVQVRLEPASGLLEVAARANPAAAGHVYHLRLLTAHAGSHLLGTFTTSLATQTDLVRAMGRGAVDEARLSVTLDPVPVGDAPVGDGIEVFTGRLLLQKTAP